MSSSVIKPKKLKSGDTVGVIAPASPPLEPGQVDKAVKWLSTLGLKVKLGKHILDSYGTYAGTDEARLEDLHEHFADKEVSAIIPLRGGNGTVRLLPKLDFDLVKKNPKPFVGYSDITGLLIPIHQKTGLITFHGPTAGNVRHSQYTYDHFVKAVMENSPVGEVVHPPQSAWDENYPPPDVVLAEGKGKGKLIGGCLTLLRQLMGTEFEIDTRNCIVFLEDLQEEPHSIDRMLTQLLLAGKLKDAAGIVVGECIDCRPGDSRRNVLNYNYSIEHVLKDRLGELGIPVIYGVRFGHTKDKVTLPIGVQATLEASKDKVLFRIDESGVMP
ncbi:MAG: LD-carboxypeptidase [Candidatus Obscuribacterales bacterium]|nr:LD-carboxypeptidase [Candidatus Obscuribacterales bacterium]